MLTALKRFYYRAMVRMKQREIRDTIDEIAEAQRMGDTETVDVLTNWINECEGHVAAYKQRLIELN